MASSAGSPGDSFDDPGHRFQPPRRTAARPKRSVVEGGSDSAQRHAFPSESPDFRKRCLLSRIRFQVLAVVGQPRAERDVPDTPALASFVPQSVAGPFADRLAFPLAHRAH
jgi:hypothetical protein